MWSIKQQITFWQLYRTPFVKGHEIKATGLQSPFSLPLVKCSSKRRFIPLFSRYLFLPYFFPFFFLIPDQLLINARHNRYVEKNKGTREREREVLSTWRWKRKEMTGKWNTWTISRVLPVNKSLSRLWYIEARSLKQVPVNDCID